MAAVGEAIWTIAAGKQTRSEPKRWIDASNGTAAGSENTRADPALWLAVGWIRLLALCNVPGPHQRHLPLGPNTETAK